jgi:hypothetical protein
MYFMKVASENGVCLQRGSNSEFLLGENIKDKQSTYDVTLKRVCAITVAVEK